ncbi:MAG: hypothetical protein JXB39_08500 [Deltaproteobacteria bacterium]|nr:hypothetical protein [Deltaproteobacteria bacterium]
MILLALALACVEPRVPAPGLPADLAAAPLVVLADERAGLEGRDDLDAIDRRRLLDLAWRNRSPAQVSDDLSGVRPDRREEEAALRREWRTEHVAYSWDNLNPDAQMEPQPEHMSLTWRVLATKLPWARAHQPFEEPWISEYFARKRWYVVRGGPVALSVIDQVQLDRLHRELEAMTASDLEAWRSSLPLPEMSPEEAALEARLATELLALRSEQGG